MTTLLFPPPLSWLPHLTSHLPSSKMYTDKVKGVCLFFFLLFPFVLCPFLLSCYLPFFRPPSFPSFPSSWFLLIVSPELDLLLSLCLLSVIMPHFLLNSPPFLPSFLPSDSFSLVHPHPTYCCRCAYSPFLFQTLLLPSFLSFFPSFIPSIWFPSIVSLEPNFCVGLSPRRIVLRRLFKVHTKLGWVGVRVGGALRADCYATSRSCSDLASNHTNAPPGPLISTCPAFLPFLPSLALLLLLFQLFSTYDFLLFLLLLLSL